MEIILLKQSNKNRTLNARSYDKNLMAYFFFVFSSTEKLVVRPHGHVLLIYSTGARNCGRLCGISVSDDVDIGRLHDRSRDSQTQRSFRLQTDQRRPVGTFGYEMDRPRALGLQVSEKNRAIYEFVCVIKQ